MVLDVVQLEHDEPLLQQVQVLRPIQQEIELPAPIIRPDHIKEVLEVELLRRNPLLPDRLPILPRNKLVKAIKPRDKLRPQRQTIIIGL